jgi:hypothetical protein
MKTIILLTAVLGMIGCSSTKYAYQKARIDWYNFNRTIKYNLNQPVVKQKAYF